MIYHFRIGTVTLRIRTIPDQQSPRTGELNTGNVLILEFGAHNGGNPIRNLAFGDGSNHKNCDVW
jgi:hypothetical protein